MIEALFEAAKGAMERAHAPYSNYSVGAAVLSDSGAIHVGCNVENAVYPLGQCAERVAIQAMIAAGDKSIKALLLVTENGATPCGACRQVMSEFCDPKTPVYIAKPTGVIQDTTIGDLLPHAFKLG